MTLYESQRTSALSEDAAYYGPPIAGSNRANISSPDRPAEKLTTEDFIDAWFVGFT